MNNAELRDNLINTRIWIGKDNKKLSELLQKRLFKIKRLETKKVCSSKAR